MFQCWVVHKWLVTATWFSVFPHRVVGHYPIMSGSRNQVVGINFPAEKSVEENKPLVSWFKSTPLRWVFIHSTWWHLAGDSQCFARYQKRAHCNYHPTDKIGSVVLSSLCTSIFLHLESAVCLREPKNVISCICVYIEKWIVNLSWILYHLSLHLHIHTHTYIPI